jgi:hypothetical protein
LAIDDCNGIIDSLFGFAIVLFGGIPLKADTGMRKTMWLLHILN